MAKITIKKEKLNQKVKRHEIPDNTFYIDDEDSLCFVTDAGDHYFF